MEEYLEFAKKLAYEAGDIMLKYFQIGLEYKVKEDKTPVTKADEEINDLVIKKVSEKYPDHAVSGEEKSTKGNSKFVWVCDPIDGTIPFMKGVPISVFSLALAKDGEPVVGTVYDPHTKRLFSACRGKGAFLNDQQLKVSSRKADVSALVDIEWWPETEHDVDTAMHTFSLDTRAYVLHLGSIAYAGCLVAAGQYEACVYAGTKGKNVDIAAVKIIIEEAGGRVTDLFGNGQRYDVRDIKGAVLSNAVVHPKILEYTKDL